jgi:hypothetical protein
VKKQAKEITPSCVKLMGIGDVKFVDLKGIGKYKGEVKCTVLSLSKESARIQPENDMKCYSVPHSAINLYKVVEEVKPEVTE